MSGYFFSHFIPQTSNLIINAPPFKYFLPQASKKCTYKLKTKIVPLIEYNN